MWAVRLQSDRPVGRSLGRAEQIVPCKRPVSLEGDDNVHERLLHHVDDRTATLQKSFFYPFRVDKHNLL